MFNQHEQWNFGMGKKGRSHGNQGFAPGTERQGSAVNPIAGMEHMVHSMHPAQGISHFPGSAVHPVPVTPHYSHVSYTSPPGLVPPVQSVASQVQPQPVRPTPPPHSPQPSRTVTPQRSMQHAHPVNPLRVPQPARPVPPPPQPIVRPVPAPVPITTSPPVLRPPVPFTDYGPAPYVVNIEQAMWLLGTEVTCL